MEARGTLGFCWHSVDLYAGYRGVFILWQLLRLCAYKLYIFLNICYTSIKEQKVFIAKDFFFKWEQTMTMTGQAEHTPEHGGSNWKVILKGVMCVKWPKKFCLVFINYSLRYSMCMFLKGKSWVISVVT